MKNKEDTLRKLNLTRLDQANINKDLIILEVEPQTLINHRRFDVMAKYIYGNFFEKKLNSSWGYRLYEDHIWTFNNYEEDDGSGKKGIASFVSSFNTTLNSVKATGFDDNISLIPINENNVPIDGAHRLTAALLYNKKVKTIKIEDNNTNYNYEFFKRKGLLSKWGDAIAYEYCKLKKETFIILLFPKALKKKEKVKNILNRLGSIYYERDIKLEKEGPRNLLLQLFKGKNGGEELISSVNDGIMSYYFNGLKQEIVSVFVFETKELVNLLSVKEELEKLYDKFDCAFYMNEAHRDTLRLSQLFFNENSIHFLNNAVPKDFKMFKKNISDYKKLLKENDVDSESFCVTHNTVLAAYGLRESTELNFVQYGHNNIEENIFKFKRLACSNDKLLKFHKSIDDIIFNPENHFYFEGVKFTALKTIKEIKKKQRAPGDKKDIYNINRLIVNLEKDLKKQLLWYSLTKKIKINKLKIIAIKLRFKTVFKRIIKGRY